MGIFTKGGTKRVLFVGTHGKEDMNKATLPFMMAMWAKENGLDPSIWLTDDAILLVKKGYADDLKAPDYKPFKFYLDKIVEKKIKIYICHLSMAKRGISESFEECVGNVIKSGAQRLIDELKVGSVVTF
ncbi:MAG: DsrE family protein [Nitrospirota bacterium]|jgi:uncharacterized protein involved in oxidation of intracellular sulfur